ncbi:hypothetical protein BDW67DRAFT_159658, partial [Aspergillus spinulosporus]
MMQSILKLGGGFVDLTLSLIWAALLASGIYSILSNCFQFPISLSLFTIRVIQSFTRSILFSTQESSGETTLDKRSRD